MSLQGKNVIITGATSGIGVQIAAVLSSQKANVFIGGRRAELGAQVAKTTNSTFAVVDVAEEESNRDFFAAASKHFGGKGVDYLLLNAGVEGENHPNLHDFDIKNYDMIFGVNVRGVLLGLQYGSPLLSKGGTIVVTSSIVSMIPIPANPSYAASKAAVDSLVDSYAAQFKESSDERIRSFTIVGMNPSMYKSAMSARFMGTEDPEVHNTVAKMFNVSGSLGLPEELADTVLKFARGELPYRSGDHFAVDSDTHFPASEYMERLQAVMAATK